LRNKPETQGCSGFDPAARFSYSGNVEKDQDGIGQPIPRKGSVSSEFEEPATSNRRYMPAAWRIMGEAVS
jgi:hypothetical protein